MGADRADWRTAVLCSVLANLQRDEKTEEYKPEHFLHYFDFESRWQPETAREATPEEQIAHATRLRARMREAQEAQAAAR